MSMASLSWETDPRNIPLCIICAKDEELANFVSKWNLGSKVVQGDQVSSILKNNKFYVGAFDISSEEGKKEIPFYLTCCSKQGIQTFAVEATAMFSILKPIYAIHTGVCAGRNTESSVKDVIFSQWAVNFEEGKYIMTKDAAEKTFVPSYEPKTAKSNEIAGFTVKSPPEYKSGNFASGSAVRLDAQNILAQLEKEVNRNISALDMEASAFLHACDHMNIESLGVIKGVSDAGDPNKSAEAGSYKMVIGRTADAIENWITYRWAGLSPPTMPQRPGVKLADAYFSTFISKAVKFDAGIWTRDGPVEQTVQGLKIVLPPAQNPRGFHDDVLLDTNISAYRLRFACIGNGFRFPTALYKSGYLIDFPRNLRELDCYQDQRGQIESFKNRLRWRLTDLGTKVEVCTWDEFVDFARNSTALSVRISEKSTAPGGIQVLIIVGEVVFFFLFLILICYVIWLAVH